MYETFLWLVRFLTMPTFVFVNYVFVHPRSQEVFLKFRIQSAFKNKRKTFNLMLRNVLDTKHVLDPYDDVDNLDDIAECLIILYIYPG